jgi:hypothetical protein
MPNDAVEEVRRMKTSKHQQESKISFDSVRFGCRSGTLAGALLLVFAGAASAKLPNVSTINKLALKAYCSEANVESGELAQGSVSYKHVAELASNRALIEHPNIYRDSYAWRSKIAALLDQDGDDPGQLCNINSLN